MKLPWIHRVKCELPRRVGRLSGDLPVKASYIGRVTRCYDIHAYNIIIYIIAYYIYIMCRIVGESEHQCHDHNYI